VQAFAFEDIDVQKLGVDMISLTAHKFYGPKGVGLLYIKSGTKIASQQKGGAQERGLRAGTENVPYIIGMVTAMAKAKVEITNYKKQITIIRDYLVDRVTKEIPEVELLGPKDAENRLPHIADFIFKRVEGESILINLDMLGIAASSGSACTSGSLAPSHVTKAMGYGDLEAHGAIRFSLGKLNKKEDVDELVKHLPGIVDKLRAMSPIK
jgi:cysteine desulfurase